MRTDNNLFSCAIFLCEMSSNRLQSFKTVQLNEFNSLDTIIFARISSALEKSATKQSKRFPFRYVSNSHKNWFNYSKIFDVFPCDVRVFVCGKYAVLKENRPIVNAAIQNVTLSVVSFFS